MGVKTLSYLDAIKQLPQDRTMTLTGVPWEEYEWLIEELGENNHVRVNYDQGRLEIMTLSPQHEMYKDLILRMVDAAALHAGIDLESRGSTTFRENTFNQGAESDNCYYVQNASRIVGKKRIDLGVDPPPDVVVEIDISHDSTGKQSFYANIGVREFWRYDERRLQILHLTEAGYVEIPASLAFPFLDATVLTGVLEQSKTEGQSAALRAFREWLRTNFKP